MRKLVFASLAMLSAAAFAGPECTKADKSEWLDQTKFQEQLKEQGYEIKVFKVTDGNCYEIYGWNKDKQKVEIYFDPVTGKVVKEEIED
ncbi:PepSY domain-containing protein [Cellvibrio fontiphilus]|uniref:PepSY domain-containing protein n=1 Tax=Cellvibrio fontiphilus TaxID=1815559 RepID=A0ABV7FHQ3_9GAMM